MSEQNLSNQEAIKKLQQLVQDVKVAMLATIQEDNTLFSRPMQTAQADDEGNLWFFTGQASEKVDDIKHDRTVYLMYSHPGNNTYLHVQGSSSIVRDRQKIDELWSPFVKAWFPQGKDDPNVCLLKVKVEEAHYWDSTSSKFIQILKHAKAVATGTRPDGGDSGSLNIG